MSHSALVLAPAGQPCLISFYLRLVYVFFVYLFNFCSFLCFCMPASHLVGSLPLPHPFPSLHTVHFPPSNLQNNFYFSILFFPSSFELSLCFLPFLRLSLPFPLLPISLFKSPSSSFPPPFPIPHSPILSLPPLPPPPPLLTVAATTQLVSHVLGVEASHETESH